MQARQSSHSASRPAACCTQTALCSLVLRTPPRRSCRTHQHISHVQLQLNCRRGTVYCRAEPEQHPASVPSADEHPFPEEADFDLLSAKVAELTQYLSLELRGCSIYLVGMMGSGKSTVRCCHYVCRRRAQLGAMHKVLPCQTQPAGCSAMPTTGWANACQHLEVCVF